MMWTADKYGDTPAQEALHEVRDALERGRIEAIRYGVIGDYGRTTEERALTTAFLAGLRILCDTHDVPLITYTHTWREMPTATNVEINASCDTVEEIEEARAKGFQPVFVAEDEEHAQEVARETRGFVCPEMAGRASGCFGGDSPCAKGTPLCAIDRKQSTMVLFKH